MTDFAAIADVFVQADPTVWLLTAHADGRRGGLIATFVAPASIVPDRPRVLVGLAKQHRTWQLVDASRAFVLHLLAADQLDLVWRFGLQSGRDGDKLAGLALEAVDGGPRLRDVPAWLDCRVEASLDIGDRTLHVAAVRAGRRERPAEPLTLRRLVQAAPPERLQALKAALARDAAVDAGRIDAWRARAGAALSR